MRSRRAVVMVPPFYKFMGSHQNRVLPGAVGLCVALRGVGVETTIVNCDDLPFSDEYADWESIAANSWALKKAVTDFPDEPQRAIWKAAIDRVLALGPDTVFVLAGDWVIPTLDVGCLPTSSLACTLLKDLEPSLRVVLVGPQIPRGPTDVSEYRLLGADCVVVGEPESVIPRMANPLRTTVLGRPVKAGDLPALMRFERDMLDDPPPPPHDHDLVWGTRGCRWSCSFCLARQYGKRVRSVPPELVVAEMARRREMLGYPASLVFHMADMVWPISCARVRAFASSARALSPPLAWTCASRVDTIDQARAVDMARAGCRAVEVGAETGLRAGSAALAKEHRTTAGKAVGIIHAAGMEAVVHVMLGYPGVYKTAYEWQLKAMQQLKADRYVIHVTTVYPGTPMARMMSGPGSMLRTHLSEDMLRLWGIDEETLAGFMALPGAHGGDHVRSYVRRILPRRRACES